MGFFNYFIIIIFVYIMIHDDLIIIYMIWVRRNGVKGVDWERGKEWGRERGLGGGWGGGWERGLQAVWGGRG